jgi:hypothetical protein
LFNPFRKLADLQIDGSYWNLFFRELQLFKKNKNPFGKKGFIILQNVENRHALQYDIPKWTEYITKHTINKLDTDSKIRKRGYHQMQRRILLTF